VTGADVRRDETAFLVSVLSVALLIAGVSVHRCGDLLLRTGAPVAAGASGTPREVDLGQIRRLIRQGALSDREALFYTVSPAPGPKTGPIGAGAAGAGEPRDPEPVLPGEGP